MAEYTKQNLKADVADAAAGHGTGDVNEAHFATRQLGLDKLGISYQKLFPGKRHESGHNHAEQEEVFVILSGHGQMKLDDEVIAVGPLDAVRVAPQTVRALQAGDEELEFLVVGAPLLETHDFAFHKDFWQKSQ